MISRMSDERKHPVNTWLSVLVHEACHDKYSLIFNKLFRIFLAFPVPVCTIMEQNIIIVHQ